ncbi:hypothetical protein BLOT_016607 [Blomia tropicalis]|nr:hypothetical protein BLOT_016607 [Blomia tropicalis]
MMIRADDDDDDDDYHQSISKEPDELNCGAIGHFLIKMTYLSLEIVSSHLGNKEDKMNNILFLKQIKLQNYFLCWFPSITLFYQLVEKFCCLRCLLKLAPVYLILNMISSLHLTFTKT